jgi:hypothetical protein
VKWHCTFNGVMSSAALLVPLMTTADSKLQTGAQNTALSASAQVNFKIIIPPALYFASVGPNRVSIMSNSRSVSLSAGGESALAKGSPVTHGSVVLSASAGKVIAQDSRCQPESASLPHPTLCTASMP